MSFIAWPEIEQFYNIRKYAAAHPEILNGESAVSYRAKVKMHGTNAAVQCLVDGTILVQSRSAIITPDNDNAGFAKWVLATTMYGRNGESCHWNNTRDNARAQVIIYGEWIGKGIQKGVAVSQIPNRSFVVFAARPLDTDGLPLDDFLWVEPSVLQEIVSGIPDTYVLPWYEKSVTIDWSQPAEELTKATAAINDWVAAVEANDPWVESTFGIKGTGEGLVFYPVSEQHTGFNNFKNLVFKAKGEAHKNIKTAAPAQVDPEVASSIEAFVELVLTPARLEQGARAIMGEHVHQNSLECLFCTTSQMQCDMKLTGKFVNWMLSDVQKETTDELEASGLEWEQVEKPLTNKARSWYLEQAKK